ARAYNDSSIEDWHKKLMDDPGASGIDFDKGLVVFASQADGPSNYYIVLQGSVEDENKFLEFNKNIGSGQSAQKNGDINMITLKGNSVVGWNGDHFAYVMNSGAPDINPDNWLPVGYTQDQQPVNTTGVTNFCARLFSLDADSSLAKNEKFSDLVKTKGDVHYWQNNEEIWKHIPDMGMLSMLKLDVFFQGNYNATTISFNDGKIESDMLMYSGKELTDFLKKYKGSKINTDMVRKILSGNIVGLMAMNFNPEGIQELIKLTGTYGIVNMFLQKLGFSLDDLSKANDGDILIAVTDLNIKSESVAAKDSVDQVMDMQKNIQPDMNFILSMSVKDKASFQKITDAGNKLGGEMKDSGVAMLLNDDYFVVSNHKAFADQFIAGKNNDIDFISKINNTPIGFYLDL